MWRKKPRRIWPETGCIHADYLYFRALAVISDVLTDQGAVATICGDCPRRAIAQDVWVSAGSVDARRVPTASATDWGQRFTAMG